jgi:hypothetical protein
VPVAEAGAVLGGVDEVLVAPVAGVRVGVALSVGAGASDELDGTVVLAVGVVPSPSAPVHPDTVSVRPSASPVVASSVVVRVRRMVPPVASSGVRPTSCRRR